MSDVCPLGCRASPPTSKWRSRHDRAGVPLCPAARAAGNEHSRLWQRAHRDEISVRRSEDRLAARTRRRCAHCGREILSAYERQRWCGMRECQNARKAAARRARRAAAPETARAKDRERYRSERREQQLAYQQARWAEHKTEILERRRLLRELRSMGIR